MQSESSLERELVKMARAVGCVVYKLTERNAPDRLFITPDHRLFFIEFKRGGEKPRPEQAYEHEKLRARGFHVHVVDDREAGLKVIEKEIYGDD